MDSSLDEIAQLQDRADAVQAVLERLADLMPEAQRLMTIQGIGVLTATALVAFVGDVRRFRSGRAFAAYLGLAPKEFSSGSIRRLGSITKHGNTYLRMMLTRGARSVLWSAKRCAEPDDLRVWALQVQARRGHNVAAADPRARLSIMARATNRSPMGRRYVCSRPLPTTRRLAHREESRYAC